MSSRLTSLLFFAGLLALGSAACSAGGGGDKDKTSAGPGGSGAGGATSSSGQGDSTGAVIDLAVATSSGSGEPDAGCGSTLEVTFRDFSEAHPDFERPFAGDVVRLKLVQDTLAADLTPVFADSIGCPQDGNNPSQCAGWKPEQPVITSAETFDQWFHTVDGVNMKFSKTLPLTEEPPGSGTFVFDSNMFFPLEPGEGFGITPKGNGPGQNFLFTTEIHVNFVYTPGQKFTFRGDDDLWIFVNNRIALDLGSMHAATEGTIDFDAQSGALGIVAGQSYPMDIFHAERHTSASNFRVETNISCFTPGPVPK